MHWKLEALLILLAKILLGKFMGTSFILDIVPFS